MPAKFEITKGKNKQFYFVLKAANGEPILRSEGYASKAGCKNGIASVRKNAKMDARFERKKARNGKPFFNLKAGNGQVIGTSEMYNSESGRNNGIKSVGTNAGKAKVQDLS